MDDLPPAGHTVSDVLDSTRATFCAAIMTGDARAAAAGYAVHAWLLPPYAEPIRGRAGAEAFWRAGILAGLTLLSLDRAELWVGVDLAYEIGGYLLRLSPVDGDLVVEQGTYVLVHQQQADGAWLRVVESLQPAGAPHLLSLPRSCNAAPPGSSQVDQEGSHT